MPYRLRPGAGDTAGEGTCEAWENQQMSDNLDADLETSAGKRSSRLRWVTLAGCDQVGAGSGGRHGAPVMALRRTSMMFWLCLRAVSV